MACSWKINETYIFIYYVSQSVSREQAAYIQWVGCGDERPKKKINWQSCAGLEDAWPLVGGDENAWPRFAQPRATGIHISLIM